MRRLFFCLMAMMGVLTLSAQSVCENEVINNIMTRTSIRQYTNEPVSKADIETMLRAGMAAPTAVNKQPWHFVAVTNKEKLAELAGRRGMIKQAGVAIVVCGNLDKAMQGKAQEYWIQDCSAATENILLAAKALGLGAVWTGCYPMDDRVAEVSSAHGDRNDVHPNYSRTAAVPLQSHPSAACSHRSFRVILLVPSAYPPDRNHVAY